MGEYSEGFRHRMVQRMTGPQAVSATRLSAEVGVPQPTLSRWLHAAVRVTDVPKNKPNSKGSQRSAAPQAAPAPVAPVKVASAWTAEEKVAAVLEASAVAEADLGAWLRARGLTDEDLVRLRAEVREAALAGLRAKRAKGQAGDAKRVKELERELRRSKAALAETAALLVLRKKAVALWGEEGDDT